MLKQGCLLQFESKLASRGFDASREALLSRTRFAQTGGFQDNQSKSIDLISINNHQKTHKFDVFYDLFLEISWVMHGDNFMIFHEISLIFIQICSNMPKNDDFWP